MQKINLNKLFSNKFKILSSKTQNKTKKITFMEKFTINLQKPSQRL